MIQNVPLRRIDTYRTDDGRFVEQFTKVNDIPFVKAPNDIDPGDVKFSPEESIFIGVVQIMTRVGPKDLKFEIDADTIEQAFTKYHEYATRAYEELQTQAEAEAHKEHIIQAPANALDQLSQAGIEPGRNIIV